MMQDKSPGVERLIHQLRYDQNVFVRRQAASALASCIDIRAVLALIEALRAKSSMRAGTTTQAIPVELFLVGAGDIRTTAASSLIQLAPELKDKRAIDPLLMAVQDEDTYVRRVAFVALCELSAQLQDGTAVEALVRVQPKIDEDMAGHPIMERAGESRTAAHELLILLKELKEGGQLEPLLFALKSRCVDVAMFAARTLLEVGRAKSVVDTIKHADISGYLFDAIFIKLEEIDPELALTGLIQILQDGSPWMRVYAAQRVRHHSDARAVHALSEWQVFLGNEFVDESPTGPRCGREPSEELRDGSYWCSWCGDEFTLGAAWAARQRKANE